MTKLGGFGEAYSTNINLHIIREIGLTNFELLKAINYHSLSGVIWQRNTLHVQQFGSCTGGLFFAMIVCVCVSTITTHCAISCYQNSIEFLQAQQT